MNTRALLLSLALLLAVPTTALHSIAQTSQPAMVPTTRVLAMGHLTAGTDRATIGPVMHQEVTDTVKLYLAGKIDQWYYRTDGQGVVFILNVTSVEEAHALLEKLPLGQHKYMEFDLVPLGPLAPLGLLVQAPSAAK